MPRRHSHYDWASFTEGATNALWYDVYSTQIDYLAERDIRVYRELGPGPGGNWEDVLPPAPRAAQGHALRFVQKLRDKLSSEDLTEIDEALDPEEAGFYGMMQALGHGVGWDDYGIKVRPGIHWEAGWRTEAAAHAAIADALEEAGIEIDEDD